MSNVSNVSEKNDGGPAFPYVSMSEATGLPINGCFAPGMTLRDYFAARALPAAVEDYTLKCRSGEAHGRPVLPRFDVPEQADAVAATAYALADAMLKARQQGAAKNGQALECGGFAGEPPTVKKTVDAAPEPGV